ncbi:MAG: molybdenum cofactor biosynthesis protein MoaE [Pseudomonadota bacterium]
MSSERPTAAAVCIRVSEADFDVGAELAALRRRCSGQVGAVASFVGLVRDFQGPEPGGAPVTELLLEHYPGMTESSIGAMCQEALERWRLLDVVIVHRVGRLAPNDQIVFVQVASAHRPDAFAACEFLMDYLKTEAVLWKREGSAAGGRWLEPTQSDQERRRKW